ncbi:MAG TPA: hypothetical protein VHW60_01300, partial [Caulobacteraceae bacterium]|nr:hypothetical protein [Caulobacteraceae bacterium]
MDARSAGRKGAAAGGQADAPTAPDAPSPPSERAPKQPPTIRKARLAATRAAILQSALETFSERGF